MGGHFGHHLYEKEIQYLIKYEWAVHLDDILWRRTKLGLYLTENEKNTLQEWMKGTTNSLNYLRAMQ